MITFDSVTKQFGKERALNNVSLRFEKGKVYGLIGPNGSGKSTALKLIAGLSRPTQGEVKVNNLLSNRRICSNVAYLTELDSYYISFTVKDIIDFYNSQFADFQMERAEELLSFMNLNINKQLKSLSKGNRGRVKLVLALARNADVILLDEPFSGLDPLVRDSIVKGLISYLDFENQTVIVATHEISEIEPLLDEVVAINDGTIIAVENVEQLRETKGLSVLEWMKSLFE